MLMTNKSNVSLFLRAARCQRMPHPSFEGGERSSGRKAKSLSFKQAICNQVICLIAGPALPCKFNCETFRRPEGANRGTQKRIDKASRSVESKTRRMSKFKLTFDSIDDVSSGFRFLFCARKTQRAREGIIAESLLFRITFRCLAMPNNVNRFSS